MNTILILDDHGIVRTGMRLLLKELIPNLNFYEASKKEEAYTIIKEVPFIDLIILDVNIPNYSCERMIEYCAIKCPNAKIMILSMNSESMMAKRFYQLGAVAYVNKGVDDAKMKEIFTQIIQHKKYYSPEFLKQIAEESFGGDANANPFKDLSNREFEVMHFLLEGKNAQEIAKIMSIHPSTIGTYKTRIFEKLKVDNLIDLYHLFSIYND